jgi:hypothetical protein
MSGDLRSKARRAATQGHWNLYFCTTTVDNPRGGQWIYGADQYKDVVAQGMLPEDAIFIAAASPAAILELYDEIDALKARLGE